jgi:hypothetical protein
MSWLVMAVGSPENGGARSQRRPAMVASARRRDKTLRSNYGPYRPGSVNAQSGPDPMTATTRLQRVNS